MVDKIFPKGLFFNRRHDAPDFVIGRISMKIDDFSKFVRENKDGEWMNFNVLKSKEGKSYVELDTWKPEPKIDKVEELPYSGDLKDDLPF